MKINTNSNLYTFIYASVMVILVAAGLAFTAFELQPLQDRNVKVEKMQNILKSVGIKSTAEDAEELFNKYITKQIVVNNKGEEIEGDAFSINLKLESKKSPEDKKLPIYIATLKDGTKKAILPLRGKGLWGPIWGYLALNEDFNTIFGAVFDHKGETPGLGAEIKKDVFQKQFVGKTLFEGKKFVSITAYKGGKGSAEKAEDTEHGIDAIAGGTITSKGLEAMFNADWLFYYKAYLVSNLK